MGKDSDHSVTSGRSQNSRESIKEMSSDVKLEKLVDKYKKLKSNYDELRKKDREMSANLRIYEKRQISMREDFESFGKHHSSDQPKESFLSDMTDHEKVSAETVILTPHANKENGFIYTGSSVEPFNDISYERNSLFLEEIISLQSRLGMNRTVSPESLSYEDRHLNRNTSVFNHRLGISTRGKSRSSINSLRMRLPRMKESTHGRVARVLRKLQYTSSPMRDILVTPASSTSTEFQSNSMCGFTDILSKSQCGNINESESISSIDMLSGLRPSNAHDDPLNLKGGIAISTIKPILKENHMNDTYKPDNKNTHFKGQSQFNITNAPIVSYDNQKLGNKSVHSIVVPNEQGAFSKNCPTKSTSCSSYLDTPSEFTRAKDIRDVNTRADRGWPKMEPQTDVASFRFNQESSSFRSLAGENVTSSVGESSRTLHVEPEGEDLSYKNMSSEGDDNSTISSYDIRHSLLKPFTTKQKMRLGTQNDSNAEDPVESTSHVRIIEQTKASLIPTDTPPLRQIVNGNYEDAKNRHDTDHYSPISTYVPTTLKNPDIEKVLRTTPNFLSSIHRIVDMLTGDFVSLRAEVFRSTVIEMRNKKLELEVDALRRAVFEIEADIMTIKISYDSQLKRLVAGYCDIEEALKSSKKNISIIRSHKVHCGKCGCWKTLKTLLPQKGICSLCGFRILIEGELEDVEETEEENEDDSCDKGIKITDRRISNESSNGSK